MASEGTSYTVGARVALDVFRVSAWFTWDRGISSSWALADTQRFTGLVGYSVLASPWGRLRLLGGVDVLTSSTGPSFGAAVGATGRVGFSVVALEGSATLTPLGGFRQLDTRIALVLVGGIFELHLGFRGTLQDTTSGGTLASLFALPLKSGPFAAAGFNF